MSPIGWVACITAPRRVDDLKAINKERKSGEEDNPYDTVVTKKGW